MAGESPSHGLTDGSVTTSRNAVLDLCDAVLEEIGRRRHLFSWLRAPGAATGEWIPVDAYYPARRVVVLCGGESPREVDALCDELIPAHGLHLLRIATGDFGADAETALREEIAALELPPRQTFDLSIAAPVSVRDSPVARMGASLAQAASPPVRRRARGPRATRIATWAASDEAAPRAQPSLAVGVAVGVALALTLGIELFLGVGELALGGDHWVLALGLALDAVARTIGTIAGGRAGRPDWALWSVLGGSPVVAAITLFRADGRMTTEPGPIAGLVSVAAVGVIGLWIVGSLLGL